ncbi:MAG: hypothetical protein HYV54_01750 [Parcubacteria group bacterium]|nr:hypothetical protein [Parcubacteria group bacterium]
MLDEKDISKLISIFVTKDDLKNLPTRADINLLHNSVDRFMTLHEKLDQEFTMMKEDINRIKVAVRSLGAKVE